MTMRLNDQSAQSEGQACTKFCKIRRKILATHPTMLFSLPHSQAAIRNNELYSARHFAPKVAFWNTNLTNLNKDIKPEGFAYLTPSLNRPSPLEDTFGLLPKAASPWSANCMAIKFSLASDQISAFQVFFVDIP